MPMAKPVDPTTTVQETTSGRRSLEGKVILVTGGSRGIGRAIVEEMASQGARVAFTYLNQQAVAKMLVDRLKAEGGEALDVQADVRDFSRAQQVIARTFEHFGRLDGLVNNAGITRDKALMLMEPSEWQEVIDTNLTGVFNYCRAAIVTFMKQRSGRIVNIASVAGLVGSPRQVNYAASKAGMIGFTKALAKEVAAHHITVNAIAPGYIGTDMTDTIDDKRKAEALTHIPLGRFGNPADIARITTMLLGEAGSYITGQVIVVDGGLAI